MILQEITTRKTEGSEFTKTDKPMKRITNALAELEKNLNADAVLVDVYQDVIGDPPAGKSICADIRKAQRIVAELAKVPDCTFRGNPRVDKSADAVVVCRAIAGEGAV